MADLFERPNKKSEEVRQQDEKENEYLKTIGEQKVELDYLKKVQATLRNRVSFVDQIDSAYKVLSISHQCKSSEGNNRRIWVSRNRKHRQGKPVYI